MVKIIVTSPNNRPIPTAAIVFANAKCHPRVPLVNKNIAGSISEVASQNAFNALSSLPTVKRTAMKRITPQGQKGYRPPKIAARITIRLSAPSNAPASTLFAPDALT